LGLDFFFAADERRRAGQGLKPLSTVLDRSTAQAATGSAMPLGLLLQGLQNEETAEQASRALRYDQLV